MLKIKHHILYKKDFKKLVKKGLKHRSRFFIF